MCPYARFQSAMFDRNTLIIAYDARRGEPRGPRRRSIADVFARGRGLLDLATAAQIGKEVKNTQFCEYRFSCPLSAQQLAKIFN